MPVAQLRAMRLSGSIDGITNEMTKAKAVMPKLEQPAWAVSHPSWSIFR